MILIRYWKIDDSTERQQTCSIEQYDAVMDVLGDRYPSCKSLLHLLHAPSLLDHPLLLCNIALLLRLLHSSNLCQLPVDNTASQCLALACTPTPCDSPKSDLESEKTEKDASTILVAVGDGRCHFFEGGTAFPHNYDSANMATIEP